MCNIVLQVDINSIAFLSLLLRILCLGLQVGIQNVTGLHLPEREGTLMTADMIRNIQEGNTMMTELQKEGEYQALS